MDIEQYKIVLVNLDPTKGSEIKKTRPCLVISPNEMNRHLRTVIVAPLTTSEKNYPSRIKIVHNKRKGSVALDQIRTIDKGRIIKILGEISRKEISSCKAVLNEIFVA
jgi:mRNA interferase MazF